jgi:hypothetical protein
MPKIRIPVEKLPPPYINGDHVLRFRVFSESKNEVSGWSRLYLIKSIGQYRPYISDYSITVDESLINPVINVVWDTPTIYNYNSASLTSASIAHNHSQNFKRHDTDIFIKWDDEDFQYHDRVSSDSTSIVNYENRSSIRVVGLVATHGFNSNILGEEVNSLVEDLSQKFLIFDTGTQSI